MRTSDHVPVAEMPLVVFGAHVPFYSPSCVRAVPDGVLIVDTGGHVVLFVHGKTGAVSRIAGTGRAGFSGDGGLAVEACLQFPGDVAVHPWLSEVYVADTMNNCIRRIDTRTGFIHTIVGIASTLPAHPSKKASMQPGTAQILSSP